MLKTKLKKINDTCFVLQELYANYYYFNETCSTLHRVDGPAIEFKSGEEHWYLLGEHHRNDGPAITFNGIKQWWLNGKQYTEDEYKTSISKGKKKEVV